MMSYNSAYLDKVIIMYNDDENDWDICNHSGRGNNDDDDTNKAHCGLEILIIKYETDTNFRFMIVLFYSIIR